MRKFSKHTPEQIVVKLEKAEALRGEGMSTAQACRVLGISGPVRKLLTVCLCGRCPGRLV